MERLDQLSGELDTVINGLLGRRFAEFAGMLGDFQPLCTQTCTETVGEIAWNGLRSRSASTNSLSVVMLNCLGMLRCSRRTIRRVAT